MDERVGTLRTQSALCDADTPIIIVSDDDVPPLKVVRVYSATTDGAGNRTPTFKIEVKLDTWIVAAYAAAKRFKAFNLKQVVDTFLRPDNVPIEDMDDMLTQCRFDFPCCFQARVVEGVN